MLSIRDCLDYCDLTDDEIALIAEHEDITDAAAAQIACGLVQTPEGVVLLTRYITELMSRAENRGDREKAERMRVIFARFQLDHPVVH